MALVLVASFTFEASQPFNNLANPKVHCCCGRYKIGLEHFKLNTRLDAMNVPKMHRKVQTVAFCCGSFPFGPSKTLKSWGCNQKYFLTVLNLCCAAVARGARRISWLSPVQWGY